MPERRDVIVRLADRARPARAAEAIHQGIERVVVLLEFARIRLFGPLRVLERLRRAPAATSSSASSFVR